MKPPRARLFEAVARLGQQLAARRPLVWLLDDAQWADAGTFELLHYLARRWQERRAPILIIFLVRQEALAQDARLREWLAALARDVACAQLNLTPLSLQDLELVSRALTLVESASPAANTRAIAEFANWLFVETPRALESFRRSAARRGGSHSSRVRVCAALPNFGAG